MTFMQQIDWQNKNLLLEGTEKEIVILGADI